MVLEPPPPIEFDGVRYEAPWTEGGRLVAREANSGKLLWDYIIPEWAEPGSAIAPMILELDIRGGQLYLADAHGREFSMDVSTREVKPWRDEGEPVCERDLEVYTAVLRHLKLTYNRTDWVVLGKVQFFPEATGLEVEAMGSPEIELSLSEGLPGQLYAQLTPDPTPEQWPRTLSFTRVAYDPVSGAALVGAYCATDLGRARFLVDADRTGVQLLP
ncbi:hypothetical protein JST97_09260 [bacterium]|nr:hypothetical protein [bacterium]